MVKYIIFLIVSLVMYYQAPQIMDKTFISVALVIAFTSFFLFFGDGNSKKHFLNKIYLRHSIIFVACFMIVFYQCDLDFVLGFASEFDYFVYEPRVVCKAIALSNIALVSIMIGYNLYKRREASTKHTIITTTSQIIVLNKFKWIHGLLVLIMLATYVMFVPREYFNRGYAAGVQSDLAVTIVGYVVAVFIAWFTIYSISYTNLRVSTNWTNYLFWPITISLLYVFLVIITGRRTEVVRVVFLLLASYVYCVRSNINYKRLLIWGVVAMLMFSLSGVIREMEDGTIGEGYIALLDYKSVSPFTKELATSVNTLHIALANFPDKIDYTYGASFFPGFLKIIPGLYGVISSTFEPGALNGSDQIITNIYFGEGVVYYGLGSSVVADVYIAFGLPGVLIIFSLLGYFFRYLEIGTFCAIKSPYFLALSFSCYSQCMFACRQNIAIFFLCWTYACILIFLIKKI